MRYEPPAINFHLGETPPREPKGRGRPRERGRVRGFGPVDKSRPPHPIPLPKWTPNGEREQTEFGASLCINFIGTRPSLKRQRRPGPLAAQPAHRSRQR